MLKFLQLISTPILIISVVFYLLIGFAWRDGRSLALEYVLKLQEKHFAKNKEDND